MGDQPRVGVLGLQAAAAEASDRRKLGMDDAPAQGGTPKKGVNYTSFEILALAQAAGGSPSEVTTRATAYQKWIEDHG